VIPWGDDDKSWGERMTDRVDLVPWEVAVAIWIAVIVLAALAVGRG
jgi:hypothetical protein